MAAGTAVPDNRTAMSVDSVARAPQAQDLVDQAWLRASARPLSGDGSPLRVVDLFAGCGGLTLGVDDAARTLGRTAMPILAVDSDAAAAEVYATNFPTAHVTTDDVRVLFDGQVGARLSSRERFVARRFGSPDILLGGPPCQGHSDFNNRTRRVDVKNRLYGRMVRAAEVLQPAHILVENVPGAIHDRGGVVQRTADHLENLGYAVDLGVVDVRAIGVAQRRRRLLLLASLGRAVAPDSVVAAHARPSRDLRWAIHDLADLTACSDRLVDQAARSAPETRARIDYLFDHGLHDLPDTERPPCHAHGGHSYASIYGRLRWDQPAQTITTGFYSMCMGRYVHPSRRRTLTAHEAARLQYIPDWFDFSAVTRRTSLATMIGNAVPSRLAYAVAVEWLR
jgi:DNA (cytosine-5)-methyltransferase 1